MTTLNVTMGKKFIQHKVKVTLSHLMTDNILIHIISPYTAKSLQLLFNSKRAGTFFSIHSTPIMLTTTSLRGNTSLKKRSPTDEN